MLRALFFLTLSTLAHAADPEPVASSGTYLQAGLALTFVVAVLVGTAWLARKVSGGKGFGQGGLKVIGGVALGPRERIVLIEVGNEWLVVGLVPGQIRTLHRLEKGQLADVAPTGDKNFADWLNSLTTRRQHDQ